MAPNRINPVVIVSSVFRHHSGEYQFLGANDIFRKPGDSLVKPRVQIGAYDCGVEKVGLLEQGSGKLFQEQACGIDHCVPRRTGVEVNGSIAVWAATLLWSLSLWLAPLFLSLHDCSVRRTALSLMRCRWLNGVLFLFVADASEIRLAQKQQQQPVYGPKSLISTS